MRYHVYLLGLSVAFTCAQDAYTLGGVKNLSDFSGVNGATFSEQGCALLENRLQKALTLQEEARRDLREDYSLQYLGRQNLEGSLVNLMPVWQIEQNCIGQIDKEAVRSRVNSFIASVWRDDQGHNQFPTDDNGNALSNESLVQRLVSYFTPEPAGLSAETTQFKTWLGAAEADLKGRNAVVRPEALYAVAKKHKAVQSQNAFVNAVIQDYNNRYQHLNRGWANDATYILANVGSYERDAVVKPNTDGERRRLGDNVRRAWLQYSALECYDGEKKRTKEELVDLWTVKWSAWQPDSEKWRNLLGHVIAGTQSGVDNCDFYVDGQLEKGQLKIHYEALFDLQIKKDLEALASFPAAPRGTTIEGLIHQKNWDQNAWFMRLKNTNLIPEAEMLNVLYYITQQPNAQDLWDGLNTLIESYFGSCADGKRTSWDDAKRFLALDRAQKKNADNDQRKHITLLSLKTFFEETLRQSYAQKFSGEGEALEACLFLSNNVAGLIPYFSFIKQNSPAAGLLNDDFLPQNLFKIFLPSAPSVLLDYLSGNGTWKDLIQKTPRVQMALECDPDLYGGVFEAKHKDFMPEVPVGDMVTNFPEVEAKRQMVTELIKLGIFVKA